MSDYSTTQADYPGEQEQLALEPIPVKMYQSDDRLTVAAPMPGMEPQDIVVEVTSGDQLVLHGRLRGFFKGVNALLLDEWTAGGYYRELKLPQPVDGSLATITYGNGVLVVTLPISQRTRPATLRLQTVAPNTGQRVGSAGHPPRPMTTAEHVEAINREEEQHGGPVGRAVFGITAGAPQVS